jgi:hypothetical protein
MTAPIPTSSFYVGWDVGGWNCDKNGKSRDAIVILDAALQIVGKPWRGNLRSVINEAATTPAFLNALFGLCGAAPPPATARVTLAIDTPLGFPKAFVHLITCQGIAPAIDRSATNPYLFRHTERFLFERGLTPLSAIKDMIGSQATKGMHALAKFAPKHVSCGVWTDGQGLVAIEAYPSACKATATMAALRQPYPTLDHVDKQDALTCALVAYLYYQRRETLESPSELVPSGEGWIWVPRDAVQVV